MSSREDENDFDKVFEEIAPDQGHVDSGIVLSTADMERLDDFYGQHAHSETSTTEERANILSRAQDPNGKNTPTKKEKAILNSIEVRRLFHLEDINRINHLVADNILGRRLKLERGCLGLVEV
ncbi:hypothetical protein M422DRAFT_241881 [Sphaerobolus stellatus SS14]|nr:hypothetical protein M422DRAFT_241881 [Sphaerobolus stellatus SS14]